MKKHPIKLAKVVTKPLSIKTGAIIGFPGFRLHDDGLEIVGQPTLNDYVRVGAYIRYVEKGSQWWLADWLAYGRTRPDWAERIDQAQHLTGYSLENCERLKYLAERVPRRRRRVADLTIGHHKAIESLPEKAGDQLLDEAITEGWTVHELRRRVRRFKRRTVAQGEAELSGMFHVIYADAPWRYGSNGVIGDGDGYGRAQRHYDDMSIEDLCKMPIEAHALPDAVLFLWVTTPMLFYSTDGIEPDPFRLIRAWGFTYKSNIVWDKVLHNFGNYVSVRHEHLLIATRGSCLPDRHIPMVDSVQTIRRSDVHSAKPNDFRTDVIERLYDGPYLELFARAHVPGRTCWGNEVQGPVLERVG